MKLSDFANSNQGKQQESFTQKEKINLDEKQKQTYEKMFDECSNMSQDQLLNKLLSSVSEQKKQGNFDINSINKNLQSIMPFLSEEQKKNIMTLLEKIK